MALGEDLLKRSHRATCGALEREVNVNPSNLLKAKIALKKKGFMIVGTSERKDKIWFVAPGAALL